MLNYAVFASGSGSNLQALIDAQGSVITAAQPVLVISTKADAYALTRAETAGIATAVVPRSEGMEDEISALLEAHKIDFIVLAGWLTIFSNEFISRHNERIINTHPSLLPAFGGVGMYGMHVHRAVIAAGATESGATVHYVNEVVDGGDIILQKSVAVEVGDTPESLQKRILEQCEWVILPQAVQMVAEKLNQEKTSC
ncbi:MAG: phosphoribosylglycinamide formyltransferase [Oscillospiraceae bacterium]|nr:phosphoribosylglycinamide formyltransferase [Oscillospiraceae bacterium]